MIKIDAQSVREELAEQASVFDDSAAEERLRLVESWSDGDINNTIMDIRVDWFWETVTELVRFATDEVVRAAEAGSEE